MKGEIAFPTTNFFPSITWEEKYFHYDFALKTCVVLSVLFYRSSRI